MLDGSSSSASSMLIGIDVVEVLLAGGDEPRDLLLARDHRLQTHGGRRKVALDHQVDRVDGRLGVDPRQPPPAPVDLEVDDVATQRLPDDLEIDRLVARQLGAVDGGEAAQPLVPLGGVLVDRRRRQIDELVVVGVDARLRRPRRIVRELVVPEAIGELGERDALGRRRRRCASNGSDGRARASGSDESDQGDESDGNVTHGPPWAAMAAARSGTVAHRPDAAPDSSGQRQCGRRQGNTAGRPKVRGAFERLGHVEPRSGVPAHRWGRRGRENAEKAGAS